VGNLATTVFFLDDFTAEGAESAEEEKREMNNSDIELANRKFDSTLFNPNI
jgi:hypothetical protein